MLHCDLYLFPGARYINTASFKFKFCSFQTFLDPQWNSGSTALSPTCQAGGHKHHSLLPSVIERLSQRSCDVFTLTADLCGREHAMSRRIVSNLNTTLQWSWLWPMYGASVYPAPISLTGPRRSRTLALSGSAGSQLVPCLM